MSVLLQWFCLNFYSQATKAHAWSEVCLRSVIDYERQLSLAFLVRLSLRRPRSRDESRRSVAPASTDSLDADRIIVCQRCSMPGCGVVCICGAMPAGSRRNDHRGPKLLPVLRLWRRLSVVFATVRKYSSVGHFLGAVKRRHMMRCAQFSLRQVCYTRQQ